MAALSARDQRILLLSAWDGLGRRRPRRGAGDQPGRRGRGAVPGPGPAARRVEPGRHRHRLTRPSTVAGRTARSPTPRHHSAEPHCSNTSRRSIMSDDENPRPADRSDDDTFAPAAGRRPGRRRRRRSDCPPPRGRPSDRRRARLPRPARRAPARGCRWPRWPPRSPWSAVRPSSSAGRPAAGTDADRGRGRRERGHRHGELRSLGRRSWTGFPPGRVVPMVAGLAGCRRVRPRGPPRRLRWSAGAGPDPLQRRRVCPSRAAPPRRGGTTPRRSRARRPPSGSPPRWASRAPRRAVPGLDGRSGGRLRPDGQRDGRRHGVGQLLRPAGVPVLRPSWQRRRPRARPPAVDVSRALHPAGVGRHQRRRRHRPQHRADGPHRPGPGRVRVLLARRPGRQRFPHGAGGPDPRRRGGERRHPAASVSSGRSVSPVTGWRASTARWRRW